MHRIAKPHKLPPYQAEVLPNTIIEFCGVSCIGKSVLYEYYLEKYLNKYVEKPIEKVDLNSFLKNKIELSGIHDEFLKHLIHQVDTRQTLSGIEKYELIERSINSLRRDYLIAHYFSHQNFIFPEHLFTTPTIHEVLTTPRLWDGFTKNRILIYCTTSLSTYLTYIEGRQQKGNVHSFYRGLSGIALQQEAQKRLKARDQAWAQLKANGLDFLQIDTADPLAKNAKLIHNYISQRQG